MLVMTASSPAFKTGLPVSGARDRVGPPLSWSGPSLGSSGADVEDDRAVFHRAIGEDVGAAAAARGIIVGEERVARRQRAIAEQAAALDAGAAAAILVDAVVDERERAERADAAAGAGASAG